MYIVFLSFIPASPINLFKQDFIEAVTFPNRVKLLMGESNYLNLYFYYELYYEL